MNDLQIQEQKLGNVTILHLQGHLSLDTVEPLEQLLQTLLENDVPEVVILECSKLAGLEKNAIELLYQRAVLFSKQARELGICCPPHHERSHFVAPLMYYNSLQEVLANTAAQPNSAAAPSVPILKLTILAGPCSGNAWLRPGDKELLIGRHSQCNLSLPQDIKVSRFHCKVYEKNNHFVLEDLQSSNGTFYEERMITQPVEIKSGDRFQIGETYVEVSLFADTSAAQSAYEMQLPALTPMEESQPEEVPNLKYGQLETVVGISLSDLWAEGSKAFTSKSSTPTLKISASDMAKTFKADSEEVVSIPPSMAKLDREDLLAIQACLPTIIMREPLRLTDAVIAGRYACEQKVGESKSWAMFRCKEQDKEVFLQHSKSGMLLFNLPNCHPNLLIPSTQGEIAGKIYRVFSQEITPLPWVEKALAEIKVIEIGMMLSDVLLALHEVGIHGFDIGRSCVFYQGNELPVFTLFPTPIYENLSGEDADVYSLGLLLWELSTGQELPCTVIGNLDQEKTIQLAQPIESDLLAIIIKILKRQENHLEKILSQLQALCTKRLSPKVATRQPVFLQIVRLGDTLVYSLDQEIVDHQPWNETSMRHLLETLAQKQDQDSLIPLSAKIAADLFPKKLRQLLENDHFQHIILMLDERLVPWPWEMAYDGQEFLSIRYCITRQILTLLSKDVRMPKIDFPRCMILVGQEDWQKQAGEQITQELIATCPKIKIKKFSTLDNPFDIVQYIARTDIVHVITNATYNESKPRESGWQLDGRVLKFSFLENAPRLPKLLLHHSAVQGNPAQFYCGLYSLGIPYIVGSLWPILDPGIPIAFYQKLWTGLSVEAALWQTKKQFQDNPSVFLALLSYGHSKRSLIAAGI